MESSEPQPSTSSDTDSVVKKKRRRLRKSDAELLKCADNSEADDENGAQGRPSRSRNAPEKFTIEREEVKPYQRREKTEVHIVQKIFPELRRCGRVIKTVCQHLEEQEQQEMRNCGENADDSSVTHTPENPDSVIKVDKNHCQRLRSGSKRRKKRKTESTDGLNVDDLESAHRLAEIANGDKETSLILTCEKCEPLFRRKRMRHAKKPHVQSWKEGPKLGDTKNPTSRQKDFQDSVVKAIQSKQDETNSKVRVYTAEDFQDWKLAEKKKLMSALQIYHPMDDLDDICKYVTSRTRKEVETYIDWLSKKVVPSQSDSIPEFVAPIDNWTTTCDDLARGHHDYAGYLAQMMQICGDLAQVNTPAKPGSTAKPDYSKIYHYLSDVLDRKPPPKLEPFESAVVVDLLQTLANTINMADTSQQTDILTQKYDRLAEGFNPSNIYMDASFKDQNERMRLGLSIVHTETEDDDALSATLRSPLLPDARSTVDSPQYSDDTFMWQQRLRPCVKGGRRGRPSDVEYSRMETRLKKYQDEIQNYTLNPFGVDKEILRLKKAEKSNEGEEVV